MICDCMAFLLLLLRWAPYGCPLSRVLLTLSGVGFFFFLPRLLHMYRSGDFFPSAHSTFFFFFFWWGGGGGGGNLIDMLAVLYTS